MRATYTHTHWPQVPNCQSSISQINAELLKTNPCSRYLSFLCLLSHSHRDCTVVYGFCLSLGKTSKEHTCISAVFQSGLRLVSPVGFGHHGCEHRPVSAHPKRSAINPPTLSPYAWYITKLSILSILLSVDSRNSQMHWPDWHCMRLTKIPNTCNDLFHILSINMHFGWEFAEQSNDIWFPT